MEVRYEHMMPREVDAAVNQCPTLFLPLGTVEWHGLHNVFGVDSLKAHELCVRAAQIAGGIVFPPVYGGVGGVDEPHTFVMDPEVMLESPRQRPWLDRLLSEGARQGFKAIIVLTGHGGAGQQIIVRESAVRMSRALNIPILSTSNHLLALDEGYQLDHAAASETSIMMHLFPDKVDLARLGEAPHQGVGGLDPQGHASAEMGKRFHDAITGRLARLAATMPEWDERTHERFLMAEEALIDRQLALAEEANSPWGAWRHIGEGVFDAYPKLLDEGRFEEIAALVEKL
jgi:creatinine amidohydrolase